MDIKEQFYKAIKKAGRAMLEVSVDTSETRERLLGILFEKVLDELFPGKKGVRHPAAEETTSELIRLGVPKGSLDVGFMKTTVPLLNVAVILHRMMYPQGTVQIIWKDYRHTVRPGLPAKELARALLDLDALMPEFEARGKIVIDRIAIERKALQIVQITVKHQLEAVLPAMGIRCGYDIQDTKVHIDMTKTFSGSLDIPLTELADFLADPERILSALQPPAEGDVVDTHMTFPTSYPRTFGSIIQFP